MFDKNKVWKNIDAELFPEVNPVYAVTKIFSLHIASVLFVLLFCPQFGFGIFQAMGTHSPLDITSYFMVVSHEFCQIACGITLFLFSSILIYSQLKLTEREWLLKQNYLIFSLLISLTAGFFIAVAPDITIVNVILWGIGSVAGVLTKTVYNKYVFQN